MKENIFTHDATPTWSGFIYQGEIAVYLAVKKICELRDKDKLEMDAICSNYQIEVENCEDVAIVQVDDSGKNYLSIHQVKNQKDKSLGAYRSPLVQLMLEKGFHNKNKVGKPEAYLHVSNEMSVNSNEISESLEEWKDSILKFYNNIKIFIKKLEEGDKITVFQDLKELVKKEPIKFNREEYKKNLTDIIKICDENNDMSKLKQILQNLLDFLEQQLAVDSIDKDVQVYKYEDGSTYCSGDEVFKKITDQIKIYKQYNDTTISDDQYKYIANSLLHFLRGHIVKRHKNIQNKIRCEKFILFSDIISILNESLENYEANANILALRSFYDESLVKYCAYECDNSCIRGDDDRKSCKLNQIEFRRVDLNDEDFKKLCYSISPDCDKKISDRECLQHLLKQDGLFESVFEVLKKVPESNFIKDSNRTRFVIDNKKNNAFVTAITSKNSSNVVDQIVKGIKNNADLISPIFDADQLITTRLEANESVWNSNYCEIQGEYIKDGNTINEESNKNSICMPKKPIFIKAEKIVEICSNI